MQLPTSLCQKLLVAWATPRYIKVQRGIGAGKCSDQPKLAQSPTTPVAKSGLPKAFPKVTAWGVQSAEPLPVGPGPTMVYSTPCSKVRRYGNMKKSIKATVGILEQRLAWSPSEASHCNAVPVFHGRAPAPLIRLPRGKGRHHGLHTPSHQARRGHLHRITAEIKRAAA